MESSPSKNPFLVKFKSKSDYELKRIISNAADYQRDAIVAAKFILHVRSKRKAAETASTANESKKSAEPEVVGPISAIKNISYSYTSNYSVNEFLTLLTLAMLYCTVRGILEYYSGERWLRDIFPYVNMIIAVVFYLFIHIVYKLEHGRFNDYGGRVIHALQYTVIMVVIREAYVFAQNRNSSFGFLEDESAGIYIGIIIGLAIFIGLIEAVVEIMSYFFKIMFVRSPK